MSPSSWFLDYNYVGLHIAGTEYQACPSYTMVNS